MRIVTFGMCTAIGLAVFAIGCDESSTTTPKVDTTPAKTAADRAADSAASAKDNVKSAADSAADAAKATADKAAADAAAAKDAATDAAGDITAKAQKLFDDAKASLSKMPPDLDTAQSYLDQLKGWQDKLPPEWKAKVDELAKMITDAKAKLQNVPGLPK